MRPPSMVHRVIKAIERLCVLLERERRPRRRLSRKVDELFDMSATVAVALGYAGRKQLPPTSKPTVAPPCRCKILA